MDAGRKGESELSSFDEDEEEKMIGISKTNTGVPKIRKKRRVRRKKKKEVEEYMGMLQVVSLIMFMCGSLGLISISALRFTAVESQSIHEAILNFYFLFLGIC